MAKTRTLTDFTAKGILAALACRDDSPDVIFEGDEQHKPLLVETRDFLRRVSLREPRMESEDVHIHTAQLNGITILLAYRPGLNVIKSVNRMCRKAAEQWREKWPAPETTQLNASAEAQ